MPPEKMSTEKNLKRITELMRRDDSVDAPRDSIHWASNLFRTRAVEAKPSIVRKLVAVLQMEIAPNKAAFGERSTSASAVRQMLFQAGENAIDLRIEPSETDFSVSGQILGEGFGNATITLSGETRGYKAAANEMSEFGFEEIPAGRYELLIHGADVEISLKAIEIE